MGACLPGQELLTEAGPCLVYEERYPLDHQHGGVALADCLTLPPSPSACWSNASPGHRSTCAKPSSSTPKPPAWPAAPAPPPSWSASATSPANNSTPDATRPFVIRQFFMRDFVEERALLLALAEALAPFRHVVTFNGKSFDLPLLETRFVLARLGPRWRPELHFDLLHPARRLWRQRLESCSLGALEAAILGHQRGPDVPSWLIPGIYAEYLRRGESGPLRRVFSHNRHDLLSLAALVTQVGRRLAAPLASDLDSGELLAVARLYDELGLRQQACSCWRLRWSWPSRRCTRGSRWSWR